MEKWYGKMLFVLGRFRFGKDFDSQTFINSITVRHIMCPAPNSYSTCTYLFCWTHLGENMPFRRDETRSTTFDMKYETNFTLYLISTENIFIAS